MNGSLKGKTIFDIAPSEKEACDALDIMPITAVEYLKAVDPAQIPADMLAYAESTGNKELQEEITDTFKEELALLFNE